MDTKTILYLEDAEKGSCLHCTYGVIVPQGDNNTIDFAKCQALMKQHEKPIFNFNLYDEYAGYLPKEGSILSATDRPCSENRKNLFKIAERFNENFELKHLSKNK
ncbi:hypothetical protein HN903_02930 [archaeon]|jgi:hypothetical protein|nr:hypothetical protein [archaeon]MBT7128686.1 hypothetical protein [archaeon]